MTREYYQKVLDHIDTRVEFLVPNDEATLLYQKIEDIFPDLAESLRLRGYLP